MFLGNRCSNEPLMIVFMSLLIGFVVIAILMPMFNLKQFRNIKKGVVDREMNLK